LRKPQVKVDETQGENGGSRISFTKTKDGAQSSATRCSTP